MRSILVTDTSVVYAALVRGDRHHEACAGLLSSGVPVGVSTPVLTEAGLIALSRAGPGALVRLLQSVVDGSLVVLDPDPEDYVRIRDLVLRYHDLPLGIVDASVVAAAERLEETTIATLDRRHFSVVRPLHCKALTLVP